MEKPSKLWAICSQFNLYGDFLVAQPFGNGHINDSYQVTYDQGGVRLHYMLQRVNPNVFKKPAEVMANFERITEHMLDLIRKAGKLTVKRTLRLIRTPDRCPYVIDDRGDYWRCYIFIERARAYDVLEDEKHAYMVARTFAEFQLDMTSLPGDRLYETIPDFHNTPKRLEALDRAISEDRCGRRRFVSPEIEFIMARREECGRLIRMKEAGELPERITHNDTKINNILIDDVSGEASCVIDLDTVMPGLVHYDFGDMVRTATNPADEDEQDVSQVKMRFSMYEALLRGYLSKASDFLTPAERAELPFSGKLITLENGIRFLTDFLDGDVYFKIKWRNHNLDRCRTQLALVKSIEKQFDKMRKLVEDI